MNFRFSSSVALACRECHQRVHDKEEISKEELLLVHRYFLQGSRIKFRKQ